MEIVCDGFGCADALRGADSGWLLRRPLRQVIAMLASARTGVGPSGLCDGDTAHISARRRCAEVAGRVGGMTNVCCSCAVMLANISIREYAG